MTAEIATALPALILVLLLAVWAVALATAQMRVSDAAREGARAAARGERDATTTTLTGRAAPAGAQIDLVRQDELVHVVVAVEVPAPVPFGDTVWAPTVRAEAVALQETG